MTGESCPKCARRIEAGFPFCDQCGVQLGDCPTCRNPGFRKHCPRDGAAIDFRTSGADAAASGSGAAREPVATADRVCLQQVGGIIRMDIQQEETIGRKEGAFRDLLSPYAQVSRAHARIWREASGEWRVEDLGASNKTYINDVELTPRVPTALRVGSVVRFADIAFRVAVT